jgi:hypothetical protein
MSDGHGHDFTPPPPPPVVPDATEHVVEAPPVAHPDRQEVLHVTSADGPGYSIILPPLRSAQKPPKVDPTELTE